MTAGTVLVVEDDDAIASLVALYLEREGFRVLRAEDGDTALALWHRERPRLAVLDIGLAGEADGLEVCKRLRAAGDTPVIFLTARGDEVDRVLGLELGADDYVTKPFSPRELVARVKTVLRRATAQPAPAVTELSGGAIRVDGTRREVSRDGELVDLTTREYNLLEVLAQHRGMVLSRAQLLELAWGAEWYGDERTVDVHVAQLRKKLGGALELVTVRGFGYRLD
ncbi:MAG: response regulator transcription factor [Acidimicrobiales bacterium]